jgi:RecA-family ATPase
MAQGKGRGTRGNQCREVFDLPPAHDSEAEQVVIGSIMLRLETPEEGLPLAADDFYDPRYRALWRAMERLAEAGKPCGNHALLLPELRNDPDCPEEPGRLIVEAAQATPTAVHLEHYAEIVRECSARRRLRELGETLLLDAADRTPLAELLPEHLDALERLQRRLADDDQSGPLLRSFADIEARAPRWLWPRRIALGRITLLVGRPGAGKSFVTCDMAARVSTGTPWPDGAPCEAGDAIFITAEDDPHDTIRPRLDAHRADVERVHLLDAVRRRTGGGRIKEMAFTLKDVNALEQALQQRPNCRLVVIDPIGSFLGGKIDAHRDNEVREILAPIARLAERYEAAVVIVAHTRKGAATSADDLALGSRAFTGVARGVWHLMRDPQDKLRRLLLAGKSNLAAEQPGLAFTLDGEPARVCYERDPVAMNADDALALAEQKEDDSLVARATAWLADLLADGPRGAKEVQSEAAANGFSEKTLRKAKRQLDVISGPVVRQGSWMWRLPEPVESEESEESEDLEVPWGASDITAPAFDPRPCDPWV